MQTFQRVAGAAGLLVLGGLAVWFLSVQVTQCLGPLDRTLVEAIRDGCITPSVGPGLPIGAAALFGAVLILLPKPPAPLRQSLIGAIVSGVVGLVAFWLFRPISLSGTTSTGTFIVVPLPIDWWALLAASITGAGIGWFLASWLGRPRRSSSALSN